DRAENLFLQLEGSPYAKSALEFLLELYQKEKDWIKAIGVTSRLADVSGQSHNKEASYFYCELAAADIARSRPDEARANLQQALEVYPQGARATMMLVDMENAAQHYADAIKIWQRIERQNPQYLPLVAERLLQAYRADNRADEGIVALQGYFKQYPSLDLMNVLFGAILQRDGADAAYRLVRDELQRAPTLLGLDKLLEARLLDFPEQDRADVEMVKQLVHHRTRALAMYRCGNCGFTSRNFYWHCPACHGWETYSPRRSEENGMVV
ncbi:MAG: tetratricopeptide repeat protein, partial [Gallionellaceae bacterium]|nr:tetratricopeptide repeat protein [Gallionellaceae bacterium]